MSKFKVLLGLPLLLAPAVTAERYCSDESKFFVEDEFFEKTSKSYEKNHPFAYSLPKKIVKIKAVFEAFGGVQAESLTDEYYYYLRHAVAELPPSLYVSGLRAEKNPAPIDDAKWIMREGLVGSDTVSFESANKLGNFLGHLGPDDFKLHLITLDDAQAKRNATFNEVNGLWKDTIATSTFRSNNFPLRTLRYDDFTNGCLSPVPARSEQMKKQASFALEYIHQDGKIHSHPEAAINSPEDQPLTIVLEGSSIDSTIAKFTIKTEPAYGTLMETTQVDTYTYMPDNDFYGPDSFTYTVTDARNRESYPVTVSINITEVDDTLIAHDLPSKYARLQAVGFGEYYIYHDAGLTKVDNINNALILTENSKWKIRPSFIGGDTISFESVSKPGYFIQVVGHALKLTALDTWQSKKNATFYKKDGLIGEGTVSFESYIQPRQFLRFDPVSKLARIALVETDEEKESASFFMVSHLREAIISAQDQALKITLSGTDVDGKIIAYEIVNSPSGSLTGTGAVYIYTPEKGFTGVDSFTYRVTSDSGKTSSEAIVKIEVVANEKPTANSQKLLISEYNDTVITLSGEDADGGALYYAISAQPEHGVVSLRGDTATYTPNENNPGDDRFSFTVTDDKGVVSEPAVITMTLNKQVALEETANLSGGSLGFFSLFVLLGALFYRWKIKAPVFLHEARERQAVNK